MNYTLEDVKKFILEFTELEYPLRCRTNFFVWHFYYPIIFLIFIFIKTSLMSHNYKFLVDV